MGAAVEIAHELVTDRLLGDALLRLRTGLHLSQDEVAKAAGIPRRRVRALEAGCGPEGDWEIVALARVLQVHAHALLDLDPGRTARGTRIAKRVRGQLKLPGQPGALSWDALPWERDHVAQWFVEKHPDGGTVQEIADAMGLSTRVVERTVADALRKLRAAMRAADGR